MQIEFFVYSTRGRQGAVRVWNKLAGVYRETKMPRMTAAQVTVNGRRVDCLHAFVKPEEAPQFIAVVVSLADEGLRFVWRSTSAEGWLRGFLATLDKESQERILLAVGDAPHPPGAGVQSGG